MPRNEVRGPSRRLTYSRRPARAAKSAIDPALRGRVMSNLSRNAAPVSGDPAETFINVGPTSQMIPPALIRTNSGINRPSPSEPSAVGELLWPPSITA